MKRCDRHNPAITAIVAWWMSHIAGRAKALQYSRAAELDERKGFPYTAAMEWRKAAELFPANTRAAEYSWRQWERIMRLPRRLAGPIGVAQLPVVCLRPASTWSFTTASGGDQILFAKAA